jgi:monoamine oxidase
MIVQVRFIVSYTLRSYYHYATPPERPLTRRPGLTYDIVILGAGVAGLAAARILAQGGASVAVIEARRRVGGRIFTTQVATTQGAADGGSRQIPVELGAEFIHGLPEETWQLLHEAGLDAYELDGIEVHSSGGQLQEHDQQRDGGFAVLEAMVQWLATQPAGCDMSFVDYLNRIAVDPIARARAVAYVEGFNAADSALIGIAALAQQQRAEDQIHSERLFRVRRGYDAIPSFLAQEFESAGGTLMLGSIAQRLDWQRGAVTVSGTLDSGQVFHVNAARALICVPLGVLQAGALEFSPLPADILTQAERLKMGPVLRQSLVFRSRFWSTLRPGLDRLSFLFTPGSLPATWWTPMPDVAPIITAWIGGPAVGAFDNGSGVEGASGAGSDANARLDRSLHTLAKGFGLSPAYIRQQLISAHTHDWQADPYARGAYSYAPAGAIDASARMTQPVEQTLYFAGEHTDVTGHWGTVHGALRSGMRAAAQASGVDPRRPRG